ncbi:MAG: DNA repair protein RecN [Verrucomicrobiae bacterium]|nr:DNA repair protein RecN [Verrucomicrobiae bacterium]
MLTTLRIRNLALVADLTLEWRSGFNAITGETGAGKSILIGALQLLLGERADRTLLRAGADSCTVEAVLEVRGLRAPLGSFLEENGIEPVEDGQLLLKRTFTAAGGNRQFVNGSPTSLPVLVRLGEWLIDIHGSHDHQSLFQPARQLELLDAHAGLAGARGDFAALWDEREAVRGKIRELVVDEAAYARQLDLLRHQVQEIREAELGPGDGEELEREHDRVRNAARLGELAQGALALVDDGDDSLVTRGGQLGRLVQELARIDPGASGLAERQGLAMETLQELRSGLADYLERIDLDPLRVRAIEERLDRVQGLRRKYGATIEAVLEFGERAREELERLEGRDEELARLRAGTERLDAALRRSGQALTRARLAAIPKLSKAVARELRDLGFRRSEFTVERRGLEAPQRSGFDAVEFQLAPNPGEPMRPLRAIASSGELARVMLALKTVLAAQDDVPVLIFDEVDANVGGETAHAVGRKMRQLGRQRQVLCITHLAPVAAACDAHFVVSKSDRGGRTVTEIRTVEGEDRIGEVARMLGGDAAARRHAAALVNGDGGV